ncbi:SDR family NAD(P)-dependent oxidoreductase [Granulicella aggregans]|uniref:SDR family NAD(P)-dependent oxidoreductase n=1 Tax=Granulicella aggregans TaxID=474949 RepID=UPI0021DFCC87|nr:SDR family oxidoreductase [Granulicella aggregans]
MRDIGDQVTAFEGDVSIVADLDRLYKLVKDEAGRGDIVFANAGGGEFSPLGEISEEHFDKTFAANVKGVLFTVQKALPLMGEGGFIILTGSKTSVTRTPAFSVYSATKAAIRNFVRSWILDLRGRKIRLNVLSPGATKTPGLLGLAPAGQEQSLLDGFARDIPLGRVGDAEEIASVAVFLASDDSSYINGIGLFVDGGLRKSDLVPDLPIRRHEVG